MKPISKRYLLSIISVLIILSAQTVFSQESSPSFVQIGKTYKTAFGMVALTFTVQKIEGRWIKVTVDKGVSAKELTGDVWLNLDNLTILIEDQKSSRNSGERKEPKVETQE